MLPMGCVVLLLVGILCTMLFGPTAVLVISGLGVAYAVLMALAAGIGNVGAAVRSLRLPQRVKLRTYFHEAGGDLIKVVQLGSLTTWALNWFLR
jgi:hypothetical protein